jgi:ribosome-associated protein
MDIRKLQRAIVDGLEDVKGQNVVVFNTEHLSALFERVIIASGTSNRQTKALAASVRDTVRGRGLGVMRTEGEDNGEWIIVDCGAAVVHIMQPAIREYYHLEEIWGGKPVKMKLAAAEPTRLVKAAEELPHAAETARSARYLAAHTPPAKKAAKPRATAKHPAAPRSPAAPAPARKRAAGKSAVGSSAVGKSASVKRPASKTTASKTTASRNAASKRRP